MQKKVVKVEFAQNIEVLKDKFKAEFKQLMNQSDKVGAKAISAIKEYNRLKSDAAKVDDMLADLSTEITKAENTIKQLGIELPSDWQEIDGKSLNIYANNIASVYETEDELRRLL